MLTIVRLNTRVQKYNLTAANYGLNCSKYYVIRYNMYAPTHCLRMRQLPPGILGGSRYQSVYCIFYNDVIAQIIAVLI